jgi:hypothetical protein
MYFTSLPFDVVVFSEPTIVQFEAGAFEAEFSSSGSAVIVNTSLPLALSSN